jgi:hypothetical protein
MDLNEGLMIYNLQETHFILKHRNEFEVKESKKGISKKQ